VSYKPRPCSCGQQCSYCTGEETAYAIALHNLRCACHGERSYPGDPDRGRSGFVFRPLPREVTEC